MFDIISKPLNLNYLKEFTHLTIIDYFKLNLTFKKAIQTMVSAPSNRPFLVLVDSNSIRCATNRCQ